ncbi:MAG: hypothetical protein ACTSRU_16945 [Candidatus Hodarchaeales archaeon]
MINKWIVFLESRCINPVGNPTRITDVNPVEHAIIRIEKMDECID